MRGGGQAGGGAERRGAAKARTKQTPGRTDNPNHQGPQKTKRKAGKETHKKSNLLCNITSDRPMHFKLQVSMMRLKTEYEGKLKKQKQS